MSWKRTRAASEEAARATALVVSVPTASAVTMATAGIGRTARRSTASTGAGRVSAVMRAGGVPATRSGGTASMRSNRCTTRARSDQCAARSPNGQVRASRSASVPSAKQRIWRGVGRRSGARVPRR